MMARKTEPAKPLFPLKHDFYRSLDVYIEKASMLASICQSLAREDGLISVPGIRDMLVKALAEFDEARFKDEPQ